MSIRASKLMTGLAMVATLSLAGCFGPTYGTGVTQGDALFNDLGNAISLGDRNRREPINYAPRPDVIQPSTTATLPTPQQNIATSSDAWPESPEELRERILSDAEDDQRDPNFVTSPTAAASLGSSRGPIQSTTRSATRRYLTDPPTEYRIPAQTAEYGELGTPEAQKERERKAAQRAAENQSGGGWRRLVPWL